MSGRFLTPKDMSAAKFETEVRNSQIKRGMINPANYVRENHIVCGCGNEGCIFISAQPKEVHATYR